MCSNNCTEDVLTSCASYSHFRTPDMSNYGNYCKAEYIIAHERYKEWDNLC